MEEETMNNTLNNEEKKPKLRKVERTNQCRSIDQWNLFCHYENRHIGGRKS